MVLQMAVKPWLSWEVPLDMLHQPMAALLSTRLLETLLLVTQASTRVRWGLMQVQGAAAVLVMPLRTPRLLHMPRETQPAAREVMNLLETSRCNKTTCKHSDKRTNHNHINHTCSR
jgi:hypothetical protein